MEDIKPGTHNEPFKLLLESSWHKKGDLVTTGSTANGTRVLLEVLSTPKRKWYHRWLQVLTFGLFKASWSYKVKIVEKL